MLQPVERHELAPADLLPEQPGSIRVAIALMAVGAVLAVVDGVVSAVGLDRDDVQRQLDESGVNPGDVGGYVAVLRVFGVILGLVAAAIWVVHIAGARRGRSWVRPWATLLGGVFVVGGLAATTRAGSAPDAAYRLLRVAVAAGAVVALWLPASRAFFETHRPRRGG